MHPRRRILHGDCPIAEVSLEKAFEMSNVDRAISFPALAPAIKEIGRIFHGVFYGEDVAVRLK